jgi:heme/copper-type cytochrome/quinol oxidase subunit 1
MLYALGFIAPLHHRRLTGLFLGTLATDIHLHDTYFVVAHFHYVMVGGTVFGFIGGLHYWWPKMTGKMYDENWARVAWALCSPASTSPSSASSCSAARACRVATTTTCRASTTCT